MDSARLGTWKLNPDRHSSLALRDDRHPAALVSPLRIRSLPSPRPFGYLGNFVSVPLTSRLVYNIRILSVCTYNNAQKKTLSCLHSLPLALEATGGATTIPQGSKRILSILLCPIDGALEIWLKERTHSINLLML